MMRRTPRTTMHGLDGGCCAEDQLHVIDAPVRADGIQCRIAPIPRIAYALIRLPQLQNNEEGKSPMIYLFVAISVSTCCMCSGCKIQFQVYQLQDLQVLQVPDYIFMLFVVLEHSVVFGGQSICAPPRCRRVTRILLWRRNYVLSLLGRLSHWQMMISRWFRW